MKPPLVEGVDYYLEGGKIVLTSVYHHKRGFCCNSRCRHCPYREPANGAGADGPPPEVIQIIGIPMKIKLPK